MNTLPKAITGLLISGVFASAIFTTPVFAKGGDHHKHGPNIEKIAEKLELSDAQTISFTEIMNAQAEKRKIMREEIKAQRKALRNETIASLETVLNDEQLTKIQEMMARGKKHRDSK